jgi:hypothetical protein
VRVSFPAPKHLQSSIAGEGISGAADGATATDRAGEYRMQIRSASDENFLLLPGMMMWA